MILKNNLIGQAQVIEDGHTFSATKGSRVQDAPVLIDD